MEIKMYFEHDFNVACAEAYQRWKDSNFLETFHVVDMYGCGFMVVHDLALPEVIGHKDTKVWKSFGPKAPATSAEVIDARHLFKRKDAYDKIINDLSKLFNKD